MFDNNVPASGAASEDGGLDPRALLVALNQASYQWCLETDRLAWSAGAARILDVAEERLIGTGRAFARLLDFDTPGGRHEAMIQGTGEGAGEATGEGISYCLRYAYRAGVNGRKRWIEDRGRWFAGPDGRPARARGVVRVVAECPDEEAGAASHGSGLVLSHALARASEDGRQAGLFLLAINRLGPIHREFGPVVADLVCAQVMRSLRAAMRIGDSLACVVEGKFALLLSGCAASDLEAAAGRLHRAVAAVTIETRSGTIRPSISIGGVHIGPRASDAGSALHAAQRALDRCLSECPGGFIAFSEGEEQALAASARQMLAEALNEERLFLAFDPVLRGQPGRPLFRARAFLRKPGGRVCLQEVCLTPNCGRTLARRYALRLIDLARAVLARHPGVELALPLPVAVVPPATTGDILSRLTLELDEAEVEADLGQHGRHCRAILASGARIALIGFGGGRLSFTDLKSLGIPRVTLDGALVEAASQVAQGRFALRSLIEAAVRAGIGAGAEWVDDEPFARLLTDWGCDQFQGLVAGPRRLELPRPRGAGRQQPMAMAGT